MIQGRACTCLPLPGAWGVRGGRKISPPLSARRRVKAEPRIFGFTVEALEATVAAIADLCGLRVSQVPSLICIEPRLLVQVSGRAAQRARQGPGLECEG